LIICGTIAFIAWLILSPRAETPRRLWMPVLVQTNDTVSVLGETRQVEFWTPSAKTKDFLTGDGHELAETEKWQIIPSEETVTKFGMMLHTKLANFRIPPGEVWGHGHTSFKPGWWWTLSVATISPSSTSRNLTVIIGIQARRCALKWWTAAGAMNSREKARGFMVETCCKTCEL